MVRTTARDKKLSCMVFPSSTLQSPIKWSALSLLMDPVLDKVLEFMDACEPMKPRNLDDDLQNPGILERSRTMKTVRFDPKVIKIPSSREKQAHNMDIPSHPTSDVSSRWYTSQDYENFKADLIAEAKDVVKRHRSPPVPFEEDLPDHPIRSKQDTDDGPSSQEAREWDDTATAVIRRAYRAIKQDCAPSSRSQMKPINVTGSYYLKHLGVENHGCWQVVGLERMLGHEVYVDKQRRRKRLQTVVCKVQSNFARQNRRNLVKERSQTTNRHNQAMVLRRACENISAPSRLFARYLGVASLTSQKTDGRRYPSI